MTAASIEVTNDPSSDAIRHVIRDAVDPDRRDAPIKGKVVWRSLDYAHIVTGLRLVVVNTADIAQHDDESGDIAFIASTFLSASGGDAS